VNLRPCSRNYEGEARVGPTKGAKRRDDFSPYFPPIRTKLGEALREQYDLMEPMPQGLAELLRQLDALERECDIARARLLAELDESLDAMAHAANRQPRAAGEA
jgi:hypothetical protein